MALFWRPGIVDDDEDWRFREASSSPGWLSFDGRLAVLMNQVVMLANKTTSANPAHDDGGLQNTWQNELIELKVGDGRVYVLSKRGANDGEKGDCKKEGGIGPWNEMYLLSISDFIAGLSNLWPSIKKPRIQAGRRMGIYQTNGVVLKLVAVTSSLPFLASTGISFAMETKPNVVFFWLGFIHFIACVSRSQNSGGRLWGVFGCLQACLTGPCLGLSGR